MTDLDDMEAKARAATSGPWDTNPDEQFWTSDVRVGRTDEGQFIEVCSFLTDENDEANAIHIAACNPAAILALIAEHRALLARVEDLEAALRPFAKASEEAHSLAAPALLVYGLDSIPDHYKAFVATSKDGAWSGHAWPLFTFGDLRAAARVLADRSGEKGDG